MIDSEFTKVTEEMGCMQIVGEREKNFKSLRHCVTSQRFNARSHLNFPHLLGLIGLLSMERHIFKVTPPM